MQPLAAYAALLEAGSEIVTATPRQARALAHGLGRAAGADHAVWPTPAVLPFGAWLERELVRLDERPGLLDPYAAARLWQRIVADSAEGERLVSVRAAATGAEHAWQLVCDWRLDPDGLEPLTAEHAAFVGWSREFRALTGARDVVERARLPGLLCGAVAAGLARRPAALGFHGFAGLTPARQALAAAFAARGVAVAELAGGGPTAALRRLEAATPETELEAAVGWLARRLGERPDARLGLIVPDLAARGPQLRRLLDDRIAPRAKSPGAPDARPYRFATGRTLAGHGVVDAALGLLALAEDALDVLALGRLLRSPYLWHAPRGSGEAAPQLAGARLDVELRRLGVRRIPAGELLRRIGDARLGAAELTRTIEDVRRALAGPGRRSAAAWAEVWPRALRAGGWPGPRTLASGEYQAAERLYEAFATFGGLGRVLPPLSLAEAHAELAALVGATAFEPELGDPQIVVLERLEDPGLPLDGLWVAGLTAERLPAVAAPSPFLPIALQRRVAMPGSTPAAMLAAARTALEGWLQAAPQVVFSCARLDGELRLLASGLLPDAPPPETPAIGAGRAAAVRAAAALVPWTDTSLPALADGIRLEGGVRVLELQSLCAFRAAAESRLHARELESPGTGLPRRVRGELMHAALAQFWRLLGSHAELLRRGADGRREAAAEAVAAAVAGYGRFLPRGRLRELEHAWLERALLNLAEAEVGRSPFEVEACERAEVLSIGGYTLQVRLDRLDRLADGATVLLDYKTGRGTPARWAGPRPDTMQLAVYAAHQPEPPSAVAIARLPLSVNRRFVGLAEREGLLPEVRSLDRSRSATLRGYSWAGLLAEWRGVAARLAREFAAGQATVDPADGACEHCALAAFCRIDELMLAAASAGPLEAEEEADAAADAGVTE